MSKVARLGATPRRVLVTDVLALIGLLGVAEFAAANRAPTPAERQALAGAVGGRGLPSRSDLGEAPQLWARVTGTKRGIVPSATA